MLGDDVEFVTNEMEKQVHRLIEESSWLSLDGMKLRETIEYLYCVKT